MTRPDRILFAMLILASCTFAAGAGRADDTGIPARLAKPGSLATRSASLRTSSALTDTLYVGYAPGRFNASNNWWSIGAGHGAGFHRPPAQGGMWDWEPTGGSYIHGDSLQGWWPRRLMYTGTGGLTLPDYQRPWWAVDYGNQVNYVLDNGSGGKRTFGLVGVWHRDNGATSGGGATWTPLEGSYSAWMGLRRHGDLSFIDPITHNAFNDDATMFNILSAASTAGSDKGYPGYGSQWDQLLYRDIDMSASPGADLTLTFSYRTRMSPGIGTAAGTRTGWFDKDPLVVTTNGTGQSNASLGNFISSSAAGNGAPCDSFMVYVGAPTDRGAFAASNADSFVASTGAKLPIFDPQRRWFAEVVRANEGLYRELESVAGDVGPVTKSVTIPNSVLAPILAASQNRVRFVFRVKTNRTFDDETSAYTSGGGGAAVLDAVTYNFGASSSPPGWGNFESSGSIDNALNVTPAAAWKSTGKPPGHWFHPHALADLQYDDLCGQPGDISRICNMTGVVISMGDHDHNEAAGGLVDGTADRESYDGMASPAIQLCGPYPNPIGLQSVDDAIATEDYYLDYEIYTGIFDPFSKGCTWWLGVQSYPASSKASSGSYPLWGNVFYTPFTIFNPDPQCFRENADGALRGNGMLHTSNANGMPDSVHCLLLKRQECFRFGVSTGCPSTDGGYIDNFSLMIVDGTPQPLQAQIWDLYQDTFPANEGLGLAGLASAFDTTSALIKSGINIAPAATTTRFDVPGDTVAVTSGGGGRTRVDLEFRILPGPGNYVTMGRPDLSTLRKLPNSPTPIGAPSTSSSNFWENYLADNGPKGTPGGHAGGVWNPNVWNSARMDTAEVAIFAYQGRGIIGGPGFNGAWQTTYHESELGIAPDPNTEAAGDPYPVTSTRAPLGIPRSRCFLASAGAATTDVQCNGLVPAYVGVAGTPNPATGFNGTTTTLENTKIIPDGILTPGAHVQYFFRSEVDGALAGMMPDTNLVFPQNGEGSEDGHRWQQFGVLPDRWKDPAYRHPVLGSFGLGAACMLVVDNDDRRGDERVWVSIADTLGATSGAKRGAHNGWAARGDQDVNDPAGFVARHGGQPGTSWDLYQVKASESLNSSSGSIGSRLAFRDPSNTQINGKSSRQGPTPDMLRAYYRLMLFMSGDLNNAILGPFTRKSQDDVGMLRDWLQSGDPTTPNRGLWAIGNGFIESNVNEGAGSSQVAFNTDVLGVDLRNSSYVLESGNTETTPDLTPSTTITGGAGDVVGVRNRCLWTNDVLMRSPGLSGETFDAAAYKASGPGPFPIASTVIKRHTALHPWISMVDGFDLRDLTTRFDTNTKGRMRYFNDVLTNIFGAVCVTVGTPMIVLDVPSDGVVQARDFLQLDNNPVTNRFARVRFGIARSGPVEVALFDIAGRLVRTLADRTFPAGEHALIWDGRNNDGVPVPRGVYFARIRTPGAGFEASRKLTLL